MKREYFLVSLFFLITAIIFYLFFIIMVPFLVPLCWAAVLVVVFYPLQMRFATRIRNRSVLALLMCAIMVALILGPLAYLFVAVVNQAVGAVARINEAYESGQLNQLLALDFPLAQAVKAKLAEHYDVTQTNLDQIVRDAIGKVSGVLLDQTTWLISNATKAVFYFGLMVFAMFYFFREGELIVPKVRRLLPLNPDQVETALVQLRDVIQATMYGGVAVALMQGLLGGVLFAIVGIPSPVFWGAVMAFLSLLPFVGAFIVYVPAGIVLMLTGSVVQGIIVIAVGIGIISQIDNFVRPLLISGRTSMHPLLLFFAILGGIALFGLLGLVVGPMVAACFVILLKIFEMRLHQEPAPSAEPDL
jgi:predicted PurR-regulated permease PerM